MGHTTISVRSIMVQATSSKSSLYIHCSSTSVSIEHRSVTDEKNAQHLQ